MSDEIRPKFVGVFHGDFAAHGPAQNSGGVWMNCSYDGSATWAVDERGYTYQFCRVLTSRERRFAWVRVSADIVMEPGPRTEIP
jgi:hypothetical protein